MTFANTGSPGVLDLRNPLGEFGSCIGSVVSSTAH